MIDEWSLIKKTIINRTPLGVPAVVEFNLTNYCNLYCSFCPLTPPIAKRFMPFQLYKKIIDEISSVKHNILIAFSGFCEPTLYPFIKQAIVYAARQKNFIIALHTNGTTIDKQQFKLFKKLGADFIVVSAYSRKTLKKWLFTNIKIKYNHIKQFYTNRGGSLNKKHLDKPCYYPLYSLYINYDGGVFYCPHNYFGINPVGNAYYENVLEIWQNKKFNQIRAKLLNGNRTFEPCRNCSVAGTLMGDKNEQIRKLSYETLATIFREAVRANQVKS